MFYDKDAGALIGYIFQLTECAQLKSIQVTQVIQSKYERPHCKNFACHA